MIDKIKYNIGPTCKFIYSLITKNLENTNIRKLVEITIKLQYKTRKYLKSTMLECLDSLLNKLNHQEWAHNNMTITFKIRTF